MVFIRKIKNNNNRNYLIVFSLGDKIFLERQKNILRLFRYINQPTYYKDLAELSNTYSVETNVEAYSVSTIINGTPIFFILILFFPLRIH